VSIARPADFEPLASSDPVPGEPDEIAALGKRYADTAAEIARQAANLRKLATATPQGWKGQAGPVFASHASDLATRISRAQARYAAAGSALQVCAGPMYDAQQRAYAAVRQAKDAEQQLAANAPGPPPPAGNPPLTTQEQATERTRLTAYTDAQTLMSQASSRFNDAVHDYQASAGSAARKITNEISHDGLKDSWWDRNFGWISQVFKYVAIAVIVLAVVALILACPLSAGLLVALGASAGMLGTIGTAIGWTLFGLTILQAVFDGTAAGTHKESWTAFAFDIVALAAFGFGKGAEALTKGLAAGAEAAGTTVAAGRVGRETMRANGLPGILFSFASRSRLAAGAMRFLGMGDALDGANKAATEAQAAVGVTVKAATSGTGTALLTMSDGFALSVAKLGVLDDEVPGVLRITVPRIFAQGLAGVDGLFQWGAFGSSGYFALHGILAGS
jgi:uncharacterized protein YukE